MMINDEYFDAQRLIVIGQLHLDDFRVSGF